MKIALFSGHTSGSGTYKPINDILASCDFPRNRMGELVDLLENLPESKDVFDKGYDEIVKHVNEVGVVKVKQYNDFVYLVANGKDPLVTITIDDVDTTKPWTLKAYDAAEYIETFDYEMIDAEINYVKEKN